LDLGIVLIEFGFQLFEALSQLVVRSQNLAKLDESAHDGDIHRDRSVKA
jgi:hypothetical protein